MTSYIPKKLQNSTLNKIFPKELVNIIFAYGIPYYGKSIDKPIPKILTNSLIDVIPKKFVKIIIEYCESSIEYSYGKPININQFGKFDSIYYVNGIVYTIYK